MRRRVGSVSALSSRQLVAGSEGRCHRRGNVPPLRPCERRAPTSRSYSARISGTRRATPTSTATCGCGRTEPKRSARQSLVFQAKTRALISSPRPEGRANTMPSSASASPRMSGSTKATSTASLLHRGKSPLPSESSLQPPTTGPKTPKTRCAISSHPFSSWTCTIWKTARLTGPSSVPASRPCSSRSMRSGRIKPARARRLWTG